MKDLQKILQMGQQLQTRMTEIQNELESRTFEASAGGGMVTATVNGKGYLQGLSIEAAVVDPDDVEMLEDLVQAAVAEAQKKAQDHYEAEMKKVAGGLPMGMNLPGLF